MALAGLPCLPCFPTLPCLLARAEWLRCTLRTGARNLRRVQCPSTVTGCVAHCPSLAGCCPLPLTPVADCLDRFSCRLLPRRATRETPFANEPFGQQPLLPNPITGTMAAIMGSRGTLTFRSLLRGDRRSLMVQRGLQVRFSSYFSGAATTYGRLGNLRQTDLSVKRLQVLAHHTQLTPSAVPCRASALEFPASVMPPRTVLSSPRPMLRNSSREERWSVSKTEQGTAPGFPTPSKSKRPVCLMLRRVSVGCRS